MNAENEAGAELDPGEAASLLEQATKQAKREFDVRPPLLLALGAVTVLIAYGAVWLSVRHQHPYSGPTGAGLGVLYAAVAIWIVVVVMYRSRARWGISGGSTLRQRNEGLTFAVVWICVYVFQGALHHAGAGSAIVYGIYPAIAPLLIVGGAAAANQAAHQNWAWTGFSLAAVALGAFGAFAGPNDVWAVMGIGLSALLLVRAATIVWRRR
jgi:hypothetical protein